MHRLYWQAVALATQDSRRPEGLGVRLSSTATCFLHPLTPVLEGKRIMGRCYGGEVTALRCQHHGLAIEYHLWPSEPQKYFFTRVCHIRQQTRVKKGLGM